MFERLLQGKNSIYILIKNQIKNNSNKIEHFLQNKMNIYPEKRKSIENLILVTQLSTIVGASGGVVIYGSEALFTNVDKAFIIHFIETMKGITNGLFLGGFVGFFWPVTSIVAIVRFSNLSLKSHQYKDKLSFINNINN
jgi:energy-converting hydrogenase Eha subunit G